MLLVAWVIEESAEENFDGAKDRISEDVFAEATKKMLRRTDLSDSMMEMQMEIFSPQSAGR